MKAVAFYLPQFHVIPENEAVYGTGFTEWNNVRSALPCFEGHYQPHEPHERIGYYDLTDEAFLTAQHDLAYDHGIRAFCYYYYNMGGRTLLERPLKIISNSRHIRNEFCLCWDHHSWYDNTLPERKVPFIEQIYSPEEGRKLIRALQPYFANPRYLRINGSPLFLVFAPERCPDIKRYAEVWREEMPRMGFAGICLAGVESYLGCRPDVYGFDCMVEFAPNWHREHQLSLPGEEPRRQDYIRTVKSMLAKEVPEYTRLRCAFPAWDNTPRRGKKGIACTGASPEAFAVMLEALAAYTKEVLPPDMQYLFINAWNEWGEGCHLEPDKRHGFTYPDIVRNIMRQFG